MDSSYKLKITVTPYLDNGMYSSIFNKPVTPQTAGLV